MAWVWVLIGLGLGIVAGVLLGVDRILDMCRTVVNVLGDVTLCGLIERLLPAEVPDKPS